MKKSLPLPFEFFYQALSLILVIILVHGVYIGLIRPNAEAFLAMQATLSTSDPTHITQRSFMVIISDYEQEICFILLFWALAIIGYKFKIIYRDSSLLDSELISLSEGIRILPDDTHEMSRKIQALPEIQQKALLPRAILAALQRFRSTHNIQDVANTTHAYCASEAERLDSELSMIRYIAWAIPSVGFLGTVRGIGDALGQAHKAIEGDIMGVTRSLGVAFNSTFVALLISIALMFIIHQLQRMQERYVLDTEIYCEDKLTRHLHTG